MSWARPTSGISAISVFGLAHPGRHFCMRWRQACDRANVSMSVIAGNHDDYDNLEQLPTDPDGVCAPRPHHRVLPRGYRFDIGGLAVCCVGGAVSVDKAGRTTGLSWWTQEAITDAQKATIKSDGRADVLLTHDAPAGAATPKVSRRDLLRWVGPHIAAQADAHHERIARIADALQPHLLVHGHMHARYTDTITRTSGDGEQYTCKVEGLRATGWKATWHC